MVIASFMIFDQLKAAGSGMVILRLTESAIDRANDLDEGAQTIVPAAYEIKFDKVDFSYGERPVLKSVSVTIPEKKMTAIVGPSGSEKTTLCNLIARFWDADDGHICIGGRDVKDYTLDSLLANISTVFQNVYLFDDTIENNIKFGKPDATHEKAVEAAKRACCDDFIEALLDGYNTRIGEGGSALSGGEKQRLSIARAMLKDLGIGIIFEKENINTLDAKGEVLLTILSSLAQDESRSISENCTWGIRRRFETGKHKMSTKRFLGYDTDENGKLVINRLQEPIVVRLYREFLDGKTTDYIKRIFEKEGIKNWDGGTKWQATTLMSMLENEKYKGDALLQKSYTVDFLTKKRAPNKGEIQMFYVEDDHDAIISKRIWECVQLEIKRRKKYLEEHGTNSYSHRTESNPFASKIVCGECNKIFARKGWRSSTGVDRKVWQCSERYKVKGVMGCANRHVEEETLIKAYLMVWNALVVFLDGTEIECKNEEE